MLVEGKSLSIEPSGEAGRQALPERSSFDPDPKLQEQWITAAVQMVTSHLAALPAAPIEPRADRVPGRPPISDDPLDGGIEAALGYVAAAADKSLSTTAPGYMAYIPGGGLLAAALADFVADGLNRYTGLVEAAPALVELEYDVVAWLAREFGYDRMATGVLTSGGSTAMLLAVAKAREARRPDDGDLRRLVGYTSAQAHGSIASAFALAGLPANSLRSIPTDETFRMRADALAAAIRTDRRAGFVPFLVVASAGTTNTGAVDPLDRIAEICAGEDIWLHVDGAYGGAFVLCPEGRRRLHGIARAASISFDPHKGLFLPYGTGCVLFRDKMAALFAGEGDHYLRDVRSGESTVPSPADFGLELTRPFRGLRLWLPLMLHGAEAFRSALSQKLLLAEQLHQGLQEIEATGQIEIVAAPQLTVSAFRLPRRSGESADVWNGRNEAFLRAIHARKRSFCSSTLLPHSAGQVLTVRACVLSHRTQREHIEALLDDIRLCAREVGEANQDAAAG